MLLERPRTLLKEWLWTMQGIQGYSDSQGRGCSYMSAEMRTPLKLDMLTWVV